MRAIWHDATGPACEAPQYGEPPTPEPGRGQVLVRMRASGIDPFDVVEP